MPPSTYFSLCFHVDSCHDRATDASPVHWFTPLAPRSLHSFNNSRVDSLSRRETGTHRTAGKGEVRFSGAQEQTSRCAGATGELPPRAESRGSSGAWETHQGRCGVRETVTQSGKRAPGPRKGRPHLSWQLPNEQIKRQEAGGPG